MIVIVAGSRKVEANAAIRALITAMKKAKDSGWKITTIVSGQACGIDALGEAYAQWKGLELVKKPAKWTVNGSIDKQAGFRRNEEMALMADGLIAVWDGKSNGTAHMIDTAKKLGLKIIVEVIK